MLIGLGVCDEESHYRSLSPRVDEIFPLTFRLDQDDRSQVMVGGEEAR